MKALVVDTNVPLTANGRAEQAGPDCVLACIGALEEVISRGMIALDMEGLILREYMSSHLSMSGQPGPGDAFMKWVWQNQAVAERCERVAIRPRQDDPQDFEEFPRDADLAAFHRDDRKFAAVCRASKRSPVVLNAVDSDWWHFRLALERNGIPVEFLCPELFAGTC